MEAIGDKPITINFFGITFNDLDFTDHLAISMVQIIVGFVLSGAMIMVIIAAGIILWQVFLKLSIKVLKKRDCIALIIAGTIVMIALLSIWS